MNKHLKVCTYSYPDYSQCQTDMGHKAAEIADKKNHELWLVKHDSVFTLGQAADRANLLNTGDIPVVQSNRGGQVSWHGFGQIVIYTLLHLPSLGLNVRQLVSLLENSVIELLADFAIDAESRAEAPGVYITGVNGVTEENGHKIASIGLRISKGVSYHGLSFNHDCSLEAFDRIHTCGYPNLKVTRLVDLCTSPGRDVIADRLCKKIARGVGLTPIT